MQKKPITNKLLWIFAIGQFGWSLLAGIVSNWMVYYYTGTPDAQNPNTGIFADFPRESLMRCQKPPLTRILMPIAIRMRPPKTEALPASRIPT